MLRTIELENTIRQLFCCEEELSLPLEEALDCLNYELLSQAIQHHAEPVYAYRADTLGPSGCCYRGNLLLPLPATLLYSMPYVRATAEGGISFERRLELWILEDMTLAVVSSARFRACEGEFESDYRALKTKDLDLFPQVINLDLNLLAMRLAAMCDEYLESPISKTGVGKSSQPLSCPKETMINPRMRIGEQIFRLQLLSGDFFSASEIQSRVLQQVQSGSIVLFHNAAEHTPEALPGSPLGARQGPLN